MARTLKPLLPACPTRAAIDREDRQMESGNRLAGKVAFITGGGSGIGEATAKLFAREGTRVSILGREEEGLERVRREIGDDKAMAVEGDVSSYPDVERAVRATVDRFGRIDVVFANAGVNGVWAPIEELAPEEWQNTIAINLSGTFYTIKAAVPYLKVQGGSVIVTASVNGTRIFSNSGASAYASSKAAQVALTQMLALELARDKIRVNVVCPGAIATEIDDNTEKRDVDKVKTPVEFPEGKIPLSGGKPGSAEQVARLVLFLASDDSDHITGTPIWIDGAESLLKG
jgi:NAD(P)-dependent dehydrogenase (short-subunit alcohol dehydrogenase family)